MDFGEVHGPACFVGHESFTHFLWFIIHMVFCCFALHTALFLPEFIPLTKTWVTPTQPGEVQTSALKVTHCEKEAWIKQGREEADI